MPAGYLPTLDGWRTVAILAVMICHATDSVFHAEGSHPNAFLHAVTRYGALGVDIFFGISGFLICSRLLTEHQGNGGIRLGRFYMRRFFRILPPYLTYLGGLAALAAFGLVPILADSTRAISGPWPWRSISICSGPDSWFLPVSRGLVG